MVKTYTKDTLTREVVKKGVKLRVEDEAHSESFQRALDELGIGWNSCVGRIKHTDKPFLYVRDYSITFGDDEGDFLEEDAFQEIKFDDGRHSQTLTWFYDKAVDCRAKYIAIDSDGVVRAFRQEPELGASAWIGGEYSRVLGAVEVGGLDWETSLIEVGSSGARRDVKVLEEIRRGGRPRREKLRAFDLEAALEGVPVMLSKGHKAYIRHHEKTIKVDKPLFGWVITPSGTMPVSWNEDGTYRISGAPDPLDIVFMWPTYNLINSYKIPNISFTPKEGECYLYPNPSTPELFGKKLFHPSHPACKHRAENNMCYPNTVEGRGAAIAHAKALLGWG